MVDIIVLSWYFMRRLFQLPA